MGVMALDRGQERAADQSSCFVCAKHQHEGEHEFRDCLIYEDELVYVAHVLPQQGTAGAYLGYVIVETQRHTPGLADLSEAEAQAVGAWVGRIARALTAVVHAEHVYAFVLGHHVAHFHEHVVARHPGAPREYWGIRVDEWPAAPRGDTLAVAALCQELRAWLDRAPASHQIRG